MNIKVCSVNNEPTQSSSRHVSFFKDSSVLLNSANKQLSSELRKSEVLLIASTLVMVKAENIYRNIRKMHIMMETELSF